MFEALTFFSTPAGLTFTGGVAALSIIFWDWRAALAALLVVQIAVSALSVNLFSAPSQWALIQIAVMALACTILALSAVQTMRVSLSARQSGSFLLRLMAILLFVGGWRLLNVAPDFPKFGPEVSSLFGWLAVCALLTLGLGENPLFVGAGLLLWFVPVQAMAAVVLGIPALVAMVGILELLVALVCSYLLLVEQGPQAQAAETLTDIAFPDSLASGAMRERTPVNSLRDRLAGRPRDSADHAAPALPRTGHPDERLNDPTAAMAPKARTGPL